MRKENKQKSSPQINWWQIIGAGYGGVGPSVFWGGEKRLERCSCLQGLNIRRCDRDDRQKQNQECKHIAGDVERHERHMKESRHVHTFRSKAYRWARNYYTVLWFTYDMYTNFGERPTCKIGNNEDQDVVVERLLEVKLWNFQRTQKARHVAENLVFCTGSCRRRGGFFISNKHPLDLEHLTNSWNVNQDPWAPAFDEEEETHQATAAWG